MNAEDALVPLAVGQIANEISQAVQIIADRLRSGGRLIYMGAGTSGRLGVLDASECPPTFNTSPDQVIGLIAGGYSALTRAIEGAEDHPEFGKGDLEKLHLSSADVVVGIATSGRTPYVIGGLEYARQIGAAAIGLACNDGSAIATVADLMLTPVVGPEVISGFDSPESRHGNQTDLNTLTTGAMVLLGKTYGNLMVDLRATNVKLAARSRRIVSRLTGLSDADAEIQLANCQGELKTSIVAIRRNVSPDVARKLLNDANGQLRRALNEEEQ